MSNPIKNTGRKLTALSPKLVLRLAIQDSKCFPIPLFRSRRLNNAIVKLGTAIIKQRTFRKVRNEPLTDKGNELE